MIKFLSTSLSNIVSDTLDLPVKASKTYIVFVNSVIEIGILYGSFSRFFQFYHITVPTKTILMLFLSMG